MNGFTSHEYRPDVNVPSAPAVSAETAPRVRSKEEMAAELKMIRQNTQLMGANDSEIPNLNRIIEQHERGEISGEEALKMAHGIFSSKADYH